MTQDVRAIDWMSDRTERVLRKIRAGDGHPGLLDMIDGKNFHLFGAHPERTFAAGRVNCWHSETVRSAERRSTGRCGDFI